MLHRMTRAAGGECKFLAADMVLIQFNSIVHYVQLLSFCMEMLVWQCAESGRKCVSMGSCNYRVDGW